MVRNVIHIWRKPGTVWSCRRDRPTKRSPRAHKRTQTAAWITIFHWSALKFLVFTKFKIVSVSLSCFLGDQEMTGGCHYWELHPLAEWKSFSVGVAYRTSLGRFDQLGKSTGSWCLHASQWLQNSLAAKHNNRAKPLDWSIPQRIGICCDYDNGKKNTVFITLRKYLWVFVLQLLLNETLGNTYIIRSAHYWALVK